MNQAQSQLNNIDLTRGHKEYDSKVKNLEGMLTKLKGILDITKYQTELNQIINDVKNDPSLSKKMLYNNIQMDYEGFIYDNYSKRIDELTKKVETEAMPFYELYLLCTKINSQLSSVSAENINDIIINTSELIDTLNLINTHNKNEKNRIIDLAYKTIYSVIMYEEIFDKSDILFYIKELGVPVNLENIGRLLEKDLNKLEKEDLIDEDLRTIKSEGLGYDYIDSNIIKKVSSKTVGEKNSEYEERKRQISEDLNKKTVSTKYQMDNCKALLEENKIKKKKILGQKYLLVTKMISFLLVPVITFSAGHAIGKSSSNKINEYKTITRTINTNTGEIVGTQEEIFDENETTYVATILEQKPWRQNPTGVGYIRNVTAYEYITPDNVDENYHVSADDIKDNIVEKYKYIEQKDTLDENDSMTEITILITETYQDKNVSRKSTKYILPFSITGAILGIALDVALSLFNIFNYETAKRILEDLNEEINDKKLSEEQIKERLLKLKDEALILQKEYNDAVKKYGKLGNEFIFDDIDTTEITKFSKQLKRHF